MYVQLHMSRTMRKPAFLHMRKQRNREADQRLRVTAKLISAFVFATRIVQSLYFLNPKFQASSVAEQPGLCGTRSNTLKTGFLTTRLI